jgi:hypothetical protein
VPSGDEDGHHPMWSPDGKELFYTPGPSYRLTALRGTTAGGFAFGLAPAVSRPFWNMAPAPSARTTPHAAAHSFSG